MDKISYRLASAAEDLREILFCLPAEEAERKDIQAEICKYLQTKYGLTRKQIAAVMGMTVRTVCTRLASYSGLVADGIIPTGALNGEGHLEELLTDFAEGKQASLENKYGKERIAHLSAENAFTEKAAVLLPSQEHMDYLVSLRGALRAAEPHGQGQEEAAVALTSDLHYGLVNKDYDSALSASLFHSYLDKVIRLTNIKRSQCPVRTCYLVANGDGIQGSNNFANQRWTTVESSLDQSIGLTKLYIQGIEKLLTSFDKVVFVGTSGNHSYIAPRKTSTEPNHATYEHMVYHSLSLAFRSNPSVEIQYSKEWYIIVPILGGLRLLAHHGHALSGGGNYEAVSAVVRKWGDVLPDTFNLITLGHFHRSARLGMPKDRTTGNHRTIYMTGTAILGDDHSLQFGSSHQNEWVVLFATDSRVTSEYWVDLYEGVPRGKVLSS